MDTTNADAPGATANKRLFDARTHWVRALDAYFSPEDFRIEINACIQALRNVTFVLQADKARIPNFDHWYGGWQSRMRADDRMKWSVEARNTIVKAKDLELHSKLRASLVGSYLDSEIPTLQAQFSPQITTANILAEFRKRGIPDEYMQHAQLRIERRWVINDFPASEFLELLAYCWTFLSRVLIDLPNASTGTPPAEGWGLPPCMVDDGECRSIWIKVSTAEVSLLDTSSAGTISKGDIDPAAQADIIAKYGLASMPTPPRTGNELRDRALFIFEMAKTMLKVDGHHVFTVMLFTHGNKAIFLELRPEDRSDKYRMWRTVASEVKRIQAKSLICIAEAWTATIQCGQPFQHAADVPNRGEALNLIAASEDGTGFTFSAPFTRVGAEIVIQEAEEFSLDTVNTIAPVLAVWKEMAEARRIGG
jgi:hypothetical protein